MASKAEIPNKAAVCKCWQQLIQVLVSVVAECLVTLPAACVCACQCFICSLSDAVWRRYWLGLHLSLRDVFVV